MDEDLEALPSDAYLLTPVSQDEVVKEVADQEQLAAAIVDHPSWPKVKERFLERVNSERNKSESDYKGLSMEQIGAQYLVSLRVAAALEDFIVELEAQYATTR